MKAAFVFLLALWAFFLPAFAWQSETHAKLAEKVCLDFDCGCISDVREGAVAPDREFRDFINHHCYLQNRSVSEVLKGLKLAGEFHDNISAPCEPSEYYSCPKKDSCPALEKMRFWLSESRKDTGCGRWRDIGIAAHYYFDSRVFWHKVQNENYDKCHEPFEGRVERKFEAGDGSNWTIEACGAKENYGNMVLYVNDFEAILAETDAMEKAQNVPLLAECGFWCRISGWIRLVFI